MINSCSEIFHSLDMVDGKHGRHKLADIKPFVWRSVKAPIIEVERVDIDEGRHAGILFQKAKAPAKMTGAFGPANKATGAILKLKLWCLRIKYRQGKTRFR